MKTFTYCGKITEVNGQHTCPDCTKFKRLPWHDPLGSQPAEVKSPVFLVKRTNSKNGDKFWGCPNFPKCKFTISVKSPSYSIDYEDEMRPW